MDISIREMVDSMIRSIDLNEITATIEKQPATATREDIEKLRSEIADMRTELNSKIDEFKEMIVSLPVLAGRDYLERHYENTRDGKMSI